MFIISYHEKKKLINLCNKQILLIIKLDFMLNKVKIIKEVKISFLPIKLKHILEYSNNLKSLYNDFIDYNRNNLLEKKLFIEIEIINGLKIYKINKDIKYNNNLCKYMIYDYS